MSSPGFDLTSFAPGAGDGGGGGGGGGGPAAPPLDLRAFEPAGTISAAAPPLDLRAFGPGGTGGGGAPPPPPSAAPPAAPRAPASHSGLGGFLHDALNFVNPANLPKLVTTIGSSAINDARNVGDMVGGHVNELVHGDPLNSDLPAHLQPRQGEGFFDYAGRVSPLVGGIVSQGQHTGADLAGGAQALASGLTNDTAHPLGAGFQHAAAARYGANPFGEVLGNVGTLAIAGGPLARALSGGATALGSGASDAADLAAQADAHASAVAGAAARGVADPAMAAHTAAEAAAYRAAAQSAAAAAPARAAGLLGGASGAAEGIGHLAGKALGAPFLPVQGIAAGLGELGSRLALPTDEQGPITAAIANRSPIGARTIGDMANQLGTDRAVRGFFASNVETPTAQDQATIGRNLSDARSVLGERSRLLGRSVTPDLAAEGALNLRQVGAVPALRAVLGAGDDVAGPILERQGISLDAAKIAAGIDTTPAQEAALASADAIRRSGPGGIDARAAEEAAGRGRVGGPLNAEQFGSTPLSRGVGDATVDSEFSAQEAANALRSAKAAAGIPTTDAPPPGSVPFDQANLGQLGLATKMMGRASGAAGNETLAELAAEHGLASPEQIPEYLAHAKASLGLGDPAGRGLAQAQAAADQALRDHAEALAKANADPANAPARYRPALGLGGRVVDELHAAAAAADEITPGAGDIMRQGAASVPTTLRALVDAGVDPAHLIGPGRDLSAEGNLAAGAAKNRPSIPQVRKLASEATKTTGTIPGDLGEVARTDLRRAAGVVANESAPIFQSQFGTTAADRGIVAPAGKALDEAVRAEGFRAWNPRAWSETVDPASVTADTPLLPSKLFDAYRNYYTPKAVHPALSSWDALIRGGKNLGVALNPAYHASVILADTLKASAGGGVDPITLGAHMIEAARILREEPDHPLAVQLGGNTLAREQADQLLGRDAPRPGLTGRLAAPGWKFSGYVQSLQRVGLALAKQGQGMSEAEAVAEATKVMGDFGHLTPFQQDYLRRVIPGVAFYKAVSTLALHLATDSPERIGWLNYLNNSAADRSKTSPFFLNPLSIISGAPSAAMPIRLGANVLGFHLSPTLSKNRPETAPPLAGSGGGNSTGASNPAGPLTSRGATGLREAAYLAGNLLPEGRLLNAVTRPNVHRYDTGEPVLSKTGTTPYPGGRLGAALFAAGLSSPAPRPATPSPGALKFAKAQSKAQATYAGRLAHYQKAGK